MSITRQQVVRATTNSPWTREFKHLQSFPRYWTKRTSWKDPFVKSVRPSDRIKYWNIVPGDQIRLLGDKTNTIHEVLSINKISNRVFLKGSPNAAEIRPGKLPPAKNVHYSRCQLFLGNFEYPPEDGSKEPILKPVFAKRLGTSKPQWWAHRWQWSRFAASTVPHVPEWTTQDKLIIPWPAEPPKPTPKPGIYDTNQDSVLAITWQPPPLPATPRQKFPEPPSERKYFLGLLNPSYKKPLPESAPMEVHLEKELSNPHARAKKQARWQARQRYVDTLLETITKREFTNLDGRTHREARADAVFKWKQQLEAEKAAERKRRWLTPKRVKQMEFKERKKEKRRQRQLNILADLELTPGKNQVIPA